MNDNPTPYPLAWPTGWPRTLASDRERSRFRKARAVDDQLSMSDATSRLIHECPLLGAVNLVVSTNVAVRRDGLPYARQKTPEDLVETPAGDRTLVSAFGELGDAVTRWLADPAVGPLPRSGGIGVQVEEVEAPARERLAAPFLGEHAVVGAVELDEPVDERPPACRLRGTAR